MDLNADFFSNSDGAASPKSHSDVTQPANEVLIYIYIFKLFWMLNVKIMFK
jgi:hypothetical protein